MIKPCMTNYKLNYYILFISCFKLLIIFSCNEKQPDHYNTKGHELSVKYCSGCHMYTDVTLLDKTSWMNVLPQMRQQMEDAHINLKDNEWPEIYSHYVNNAPFNLTQPKSYVKSNKLPSVLSFIKSDSLLKNNLTLLECLPDNSNRVVIGDEKGEIFFLDGELKTSNIKVHPVPVDMEYNFEDSSITILSMGSMGPSNTHSGALQMISNNAKKVIVDSLARPVHFLSEDLNDDLENEYIISSFGSTNDKIHSGGLTIHERSGDLFVKHMVAPYTGATKTIIRDVNGDGKKDILALFSQGDERIILFENEGNFNFKETIILRFNPLYGCLDFELHDLDNDGQEEIILVNGDNADYSQILKPYHGLRIFKNSQDNNYKEVFFKHINGASKIALIDINSDDKRDIVVLSAYPNLFGKPSEFLSILTNKGKLEFEPNSIDDKPNGNWMLCTVCTSKDPHIYLGWNGTIIRNIPPKLRLEWMNNYHPVIHYKLQ